MLIKLIIFFVFARTIYSQCTLRLDSNKLELVGSLKAGVGAIVEISASDLGYYFILEQSYLTPSSTSSINSNTN